MCTWLCSAMPFSVEQLFRDATGVKRGTSKQFINEKQSVDARIALGERVMRCLKALHGKTRTDNVFEALSRRAGGVCDGTSKHECMPYGFWRKFMEEELHLKSSRRKQVQLRRALTFYVSRVQA